MKPFELWLCTQQGFIDVSLVDKVLVPQEAPIKLTATPEVGE